MDIIEPLAREGRLPNLASLISEGSSGVLESTVPPVTIPAWVSMMTGKNPGKLGVFDLLKRKGYGVEPSGSCFNGNAPLWHILNSYGIRTGVMNLPGTYPPEEVDGFMVTGMMTPSRRSPFSYPRSLAADLDSTVSQYVIDVPQWQYYDEGHFVEDVYKVTEKRGMAAEYLIDFIPCEFYMIVFTSCDRLQHVLWEKKEIINDYWENLDRIVGKILRLFKDDSTVLVVSDHGFIPLRKTFYVNEWLRSKGYLRVQRKINNKIFLRLGKILEEFYRFLGEKKLLHSVTVFLENVLGLDRIWKYTYDYLSEEKVKNKVDWVKTKAFSCVHTPHFGHIYINMVSDRGDGKAGDCSVEDERDFLSRAIRKELISIEEAVSGENLKVEAHLAKELYSGPYVGEAPDIIFTIDDGGCEVDAEVGNGKIFESGAPMTGWSGTHTKNGVFIAKGPGIKQGYKFNSASILDVTPTILKIFGIPPPEDTDGRVLKEIFTKDAEFEKRKDFARTNDVKIQKTGLNDEEKALIEERLRRLGYIS